MGAASPVGTSLAGVALGWVLARGCAAGPSSGSLLAEVGSACARAVTEASGEASKARRAEVRNLLRHGSYKPTGRGKPASEYLLNAALEGTFPTISGPVDINNLVSVESLLPISLVDLERAAADSFEVRYGRPGEAYAFNPSGQVLDLADLLLLSRQPGDLPCGTPVKDSQETKTHAGSRAILGVVYAPAPLAREAQAAAHRMSELLETHCGARTEWGGFP